MYNPEIPPPTTTTSQDNGLKNDFSSSGRKIKKRLSLKESVIGYRKVVNVRFSSRRGEEKGAVGGGGRVVTQQSIQFSPEGSAPSFKP